MADGLQMVPVRIEEVDVPDAIVVELRETDLPFGRARKVAAFETGGKVDIAEEGIYNPGSTRVVLQVMQPRERPLVMKGALRDAQWGIQGHAKAMRRQLERIRYRTNAVRVTWDGDEWLGLLWEARFPVESSFDIASELTFFIAVGPDAQRAPRSQLEANAQQAPSDLLAQLRAQVQEQQAVQRALALALSIKGEIDALQSTVLFAVDAALVAATAFDARTFIPGGALDLGQRVLSTAKRAQDTIQTLRDRVAGLSAEDATGDTTAASASTWWSAQFSWVTDLEDLADQLRTVQQQAQQQVRASTRLYRVKPDDTLESIALSQLGSAARAAELGIGAGDLVPNQLIRIPEAA